jgi:PhzF family phenazine biosynthesis protein
MDRAAASVTSGGAILSWCDGFERRLETKRREQTGMEILRIAAFSDGECGGNPAGVSIGDALPPEREMQRVAAEVGFSETVFAAPLGDGWRVRYFSPEAEIPFCGHATIALGAALAMRNGGGVFALKLNNADITVEGAVEGGTMSATLRSPPTHSQPASPQLISEVLGLFGYTRNDLDPAIAPAVIHGGAGHLVLVLKSRQALADMRYDMGAGRELMAREGWVTVLLAFAETERRFHTRNAFAFGGVFEDPATGAATAAFAGYLRDLGWPHGGSIDIVQGEDMGMRSLLHTDIPALPERSVRVSGAARIMHV